MKGIAVKSETDDDIRAIDVVNISAFQGEREASLVAELRKAQGFSQDLSLIAEYNNRIVGHLMLTPVILKTAEAEKQILALAPMSVVPSQSHRGIGSELVKTAVERAKKHDFGAIIVAGHPDFYKRLGFMLASELGIRCNLPIPEEYVTIMEITRGTLGEGTVTYPSPFYQMY